MLDKKTVSQCISADYCRGWNDAVDAIPRWISVRSEEKLMHCKEYLCLCTLPNDPMHEWDYIAVLRWNGHGGNGYVNGPHFQHEGLEGMKVTHWMPLPSTEGLHDN